MTVTNIIAEVIYKTNSLINNHVNNRPEIITYEMTVRLVRKFAHVIEYVFLGLAVCFAFRKIGWSFLFCTACSITDQCSKIFIPGREFDITDLPFDVMGFAIGILIIAAARKRD